MPVFRLSRLLSGLCVAVTAIALIPANAPAQTTGAATLVGTVVDTTGAVAPAARVSVVNVETSFRSETQTGPEGNYYVPYLSPGTYQVTVEAAGFKRYVRDGIKMRSGETPRVDVVLELGSTTESITVSASSP